MHYALRRRDGGVSIMVLNDKVTTVEKELAKWTEEQRREILSWHEIDKSDIPRDRRDREPKTTS